MLSIETGISLILDIKLGWSGAGTLEEIRSEFRGEGLSLDIAWGKSSKLADGGWAGLRVSLNYDNVCLEAGAIIF